MSDSRPADWFYVLSAEWTFPDGAAGGGAGTVQGVVDGGLTRWEVA